MFTINLDELDENADWIKKVGNGDLPVWGPEADEKEEEGAKQKTAAEKVAALGEEFREYAENQIKVTLDTLEEKAEADLTKVMTDMRDSLIQTVQKAMGNETLDKLIPNLKLRYRGDLQAAINETLRRAWLKGQSDVTHEMKEYTQVGDALDYVFSREALKWLMARAITVAGVLNDRLLNEAKMILVNALKVGRSVEATVSLLLDLFEPYAGNKKVLKDGEPIQPHHLKTVVRTNTTEAYNQGRIDELVKSGAMGVVAGIRYSAVIDEVTTDVCRFLDGKVFDPLKDADALKSLIPPNHFNCRSIVVPVMSRKRLEKGDFITHAEIGKAKQLADAKFLEETGEVRKADEE